MFLLPKIITLNYRNTILKKDTYENDYTEYNTILGRNSYIV